MTHSYKSAAGAIGLMLMPILYLQAEAPDVTGIIRLPSNTTQVTYQSQTNDYYILNMKSVLTGDFTSSSLQLGDEGHTHFLDVNTLRQKFYFVQAFNRSTPDDWDQDGMNDLYEFLHAGLNPFDDGDAGGDLDDDGLTNLEEATTGTNPLEGDTDGDGFGDGDEITYNSDPLLPSSLPADPDWRYAGAATPMLVTQNDAVPVTSAVAQHVHTLSVTVQNDGIPVTTPVAHHVHTLPVTVQNNAAPVVNGSQQAASLPFSVSNNPP